MVIVLPAKHEFIGNLPFIFWGVLGPCRTAKLDFDANPNGSTHSIGFGFGVVVVRFCKCANVFTLWRSNIFN